MFPVSKLLDVLKFPATSHTPFAEADIPYVRLVERQQLTDQPGLTRVELDVVVPLPCWGTLKFTGAGISSWSIKPGVWQDAGTFMSKQHSGSGSVMGGSPSTAHVQSAGNGTGVLSSLLIKFTNEHQQAPLHWRIVLHVRQSQQGGGSSSEAPGPVVGLGALLHVGIIDPTPQLDAMEQHMPAWSTLSYHATIFVSDWQF